MVAISWKAWIALGTFTIQSGCTALILRFATSRLEPYSTAVAVLLMELAVKLPISTLLYTLECGGPLVMVRTLIADAKSKPEEWLKLAIPALLYTVQNNLMYVGFANLEAAVGQITCQVKILFTAVFSVLLLSKRLSPNQWISLLVLATGVICVQGKGKAKTALRDQNPAYGIAALLVAMLCSSFASVYFEMMLKSASKPSLWLRNIQMAVYGGTIAAVGVYLLEDAAMAKNGPMYGFGFWAWLCTIWQGAGGLLVAVTLKYADNILRSFAQGLAIIVAAIGSYFLFEFSFTTRFIFGVLLVIASIFLYGGTSQTPGELCTAMCSQSAPTIAPEETEDTELLSEPARTAGSESPPALRATPPTSTKS